MANLTGLKSISEGASDLFKIDPRNLHVQANWNSRNWELQENKDHVEQLASSIAECGVKQPLTVYWNDGKAWIDDGECRYRATMLCIERGVEIKTIPCRAANRHENEADRRFSRYLANTGKQFNLIELAKDFKWFLDHGWQQQDIAKKSGLSQGRVSQILDLNTHPENVQKMIANGQVSASLAAQVVKNEGSAAEKVLKDGLEAAKKEGRTKIKPTHVEGASNKPQLKVVVKEAFDSSDIDVSGEEYVLITMRVEMFEVLRELLKL